MAAPRAATSSAVSTERVAGSRGLSGIAASNASSVLHDPGAAPGMHEIGLTTAGFAAALCTGTTFTTVVVFVLDPEEPTA